MPEILECFVIPVADPEETKGRSQSPLQKKFHWKFQPRLSIFNFFSRKRRPHLVPPDFWIRFCPEVSQ